MRLFSFLYIAASQMAHVHYFSCVYILLVGIYMYYFLEHFTFDIFSINTGKKKGEKKEENVIKHSQFV